MKILSIALSLVALMFAGAADAKTMTEALAEVKPGMSMSEVNKIMGVPLPVMTSTCHDASRSFRCMVVDYVFDNQRVTMTFEDEGAGFSLFRMTTPKPAEK